MNLLISHKIISTALAVLVLFSTFSFTVEKHYCGDRLVDIAVFSEVKGCGMEMKTKTASTLKTSCCKDVVDIIEGQDELKVTSFNDLEDPQRLFLSTFIYTYNLNFESLPKQIIPHKDYSPPNIIRDIQLLDDVFLI